MITIYNNNANKHTKILRKNIQFTINNVLKKNMLTYYWKKKKKKHVFIKNFIKFTYYHSLHRERKHFCGYCLHDFLQKKFWGVILKIALKLMVNKWLRCLRKVNKLNSKVLKENKITIYDLCGGRTYSSAWR